MSKPEPLILPEKVTIIWLIKHVPARLWAASIGIIIASFIAGIQSSQLTTVQEIFKLKPVVNNHASLPVEKITLSERRDALVRYLEDTETKARKFTTIKKRLGEWYTQNNINLLIDKNSSVLRRANMKGGDNGVGLK